MALVSLRKCYSCPILLLVCSFEFLWLVVTHLVNRRWKRLVLLLMLICVTVMMISWYGMLDTGVHMKGQYTRWVPAFMPNKHRMSTKYFVHGAYDDIFIYSAIANDRQPYNNDLNVVLTSLDNTYADFKCCFLLNNKTLYTTPAHEYYSHFTNKNSFAEKLTKRYDPYRYRAHQHSCFLPDTGHHASHVTLTSAQCSSDIADYVPIYYPPKVRGGIALCAKIAHSGGIDPEKFIEWVEIQRIQGVNKILIFDLGNPAPLTRVFQYYKKLGVLDVQPYELPGAPRRRTLQEKDKHTRQFNHDETLAVLECRQRMGGYTYVLSHDVDEFIIPREDVNLNTFFKNKMETYLDSAGFFFYAEFFIFNWGPTHPREDLMVTRYRKTTLPHWECTKYVYLPSRVLATVTHDIQPHKSFNTYRIPPEEAVLHHYRQCPDVWRSCHPHTIIDNIMTRFTLKHNLYARVKTVREATDVKPKWAIRTI